MGKAPGFTASFITRTTDPRMSSLVALARALKVRLDWLATGEGPMEPEDAATGETHATLPGWAESAVKVKGVPAYAIAAVARRPVLLRPEVVTPEFIRALAGFWLSWAPDVEEEERRHVAALARQEDDAGGKRHT